MKSYLLYVKLVVLVVMDLMIKMFIIVNYIVEVEITKVVDVVNHQIIHVVCVLNHRIQNLRNL